MATKFSMLKLINAALLAQGQEVVAENDGSTEWQILADNWPQIVEAELEAGNYHYTMEEVTVSSYSTGEYGYENAYAVPGRALYVRNCWLTNSNGDRIECNWTQAGSYVHVTGDDGVILEIVTSAEADTWPANFAKGIQCMLEAVILRSIKEEWANAREMESNGLAYLQRARTKSSSSRSKHPALKRAPHSLVNARFNRA